MPWLEPGRGETWGTGQGDEQARKGRGQQSGGPTVTVARKVPLILGSAVRRRLGNKATPLNLNHYVLSIAD